MQIGRHEKALVKLKIEI